MDIPTRTIFRSWNWPNDENYRFSQRPTPNHISKVSFISPGRIYRSWNNLFQNEYVRRVIFMPSENAVRKSTAIIPDGTYEDFLEMRKKVDDYPFVETVHYGRIYATGGSFAEITSPGKGVISLSLTETSREDSVKITRLMSGKRDDNLVMLAPPDQEKVATEIIRDIPILRELAYKSIYEVQISQISQRMGINLRTARRKIDRIISKRLVYAYPVLNQVSMKGFNLFILILGSQLDQHEFYNSLNEGVLGERYLLYLKSGNILSSLFYYENLQEMDHLIEHISKKWNDYLILTRFDTEARKP